MDEFVLKGEFIELNKLMKVLGWVNTGGHAKIVIQNGEVLRNGIVEDRVRAKLIPGDQITWESESVKILTHTTFD